MFRQQVGGLVGGFCLRQCFVCVALLVVVIVVVSSIAIDVRARSVARLVLDSSDSTTVLPVDASLLFAQISDSHLNVNHKPEWTVPLTTFVTSVLPALQPELQFVLHTGDITDGRSKDVPRLSAPAIDDWVAYRRLLDENALADPLLWIDQRGNHDVYNPPGVDLFRLYSNSGNVSVGAQVARSNRRYRVVSDRVSVFEIDVGAANANATFAILLLDACQDSPPIGSMFNFLSYVDDAAIGDFRATLSALSQRANVVGIFTAIHYTANMLQPIGVLEPLMTDAGVLARLSGHLHLERLHFNDAGDLLDLEVADLKEKGAFRVVAVDRGLVSFVDATVGSDAPVVLVTSPKDCHYITYRDNLRAMATRAEIRLFVFGAANGTAVTLSIDDKVLGTAERASAEQHLFTLAYDPSAYATGVHRLSVRVGDRVAVQAHEFALDGTKKSLPSNFGRSLSGNVVIGSALTGIFCVAVLLLLALVLAPLAIRVGDDARDWQLVRLWRRSRDLDVPARALLMIVCIALLLLPLLFSDRHSAAIFAYMLVAHSRTIVGYADTHFAMLPYVLFVVWPHFFLLSAQAVTPLFWIGLALSSAIMIGIIVLMALQLGGAAIVSLVNVYWLAMVGLVVRRILQLRAQKI
jgi:hypothetical protein